MHTARRLIEGGSAEGVTAKRGEAAPVAVNLVERDARFAEKLGEAHLGTKRAQLLRQPPLAAANALPNVLKHTLGGNPVEVHCAARRQIREPGFDVPLNLARRSTKQGAEPPVEPELPPSIADEIEHSEARLFAVQPEAATELL